MMPSRTGAARLALALPFILSACGPGSSSPTGGTGGAGPTGSSGSHATSTTAGSTTHGATSSTTGGAGGAGGGAGTGGAGACPADPGQPTMVLPGATDPITGTFTMDQALVGLPAGTGPLVATIATEKGLIACTLRPDLAPIGTANFVGLARGVRPWFDQATGAWVKKRFYDGLTWHRVIPTFVIQGGDPLGNGMGGPGYNFSNEISSLKNVAGALAYANTGMPDSNGSQFFIDETPQPSLDGGYTVFGLCTPLSVVTAIANVPTDASNKPLTPVHMTTVTISRCAP